MFLSQSSKCLLGAVLLKIGSALIITWGKTNVYFYSYYHEVQPDLSVTLNTLPLAIMALPAAILTLLSVKIGKRIGFELLIRIAAFIQFASLLIAPYMPTYLTFIVFYLFIYGLAYSTIAFPVFTCTWSHYKKSEGRVSGILLGAFGLASVLFVVLITYITNPTNQPADLLIENQKQKYKFFSPEVANNAPEAAKLVGYIAGGCCLIGGFLIKRLTHQQTYNQVVNLEQKGEQIELEEKKSQKADLPEVSDDMDPISIPQVDLQPPQELQDDEMQGLLTQNRSQIKVSPSLTFAMKSSQFITIICCQSILTLFLLTLGLNYKSYVLSKINEDFYITFVDLLALLASSFTNILWGFLIDKVSFKLLFGLIYLVSGIGAIIIPLVASDKIWFLIVYVTTMMFDKGALVVIGPGLIKIFGDDLGHQLFPMTYIGSLSAIILGPVSQFVLLKYVTFDIILYCQGSLILLVIIFIMRLNMIYKS